MKDSVTEIVTGIITWLVLKMIDALPGKFVDGILSRFGNRLGRDEAMKLLHQTYLTIAEAQYYDLLWRIQ